MKNKKGFFILMCMLVLPLPMNHALAGFASFDGDEECTDDKWWECVSSVSAKVDVDCDGVPDSVVVRQYVSKPSTDGAMRIFDQNETYKDEILFHAAGHIHLGIIQLPFDPANDSGYICSRRILDLFYGGKHSGKLLVKQEGLGQIKYIIKNSIKKHPGEWMNMADFDTTFEAYCGVVSPRDFLELGIDRSEWIKSYYGYSSGYFADSLHTRDIKGLLLCYYAGTHLIRPVAWFKGQPVPAPGIRKIPVSNDVVLYQTAHGVLLRKGHLCRWVYFTANWERLRWPSIRKVTVSNGRINIFREERQGYEWPNPDGVDETANPLVFSLKDLLK